LSTDEEEPGRRSTSLRLFRVPDTPDPIDEELIPVTTYMFPRLLQDKRVFLMHSSSSIHPLSMVASEREPIKAIWSAGIFGLDITVAGPPRHIVMHRFIMPIATFVEQHEEATVNASPRTGHKVVHWEAWGPRSTSMFTVDRTTAHFNIGGFRMILGNSVFDFNARRVRKSGRYSEAPTPTDVPWENMECHLPCLAIPLGASPVSRGCEFIEEDILVRQHVGQIDPSKTLH
jgi:hypothetical protein